MRLRRQLSSGPHSFEMELDSGLHLLFHFSASRAGGDAARKIGSVCGVSCAGFFYNDQDFHRSNPACFMMLLKVPGGTSSLGLPGTVTMPALTGCLNCR